MAKIKPIYLNKDLIGIARETSKKLNIPLYVVIAAYRSFFDNIKQQIALIDFSKIESQEQLDEFTNSFNMQYIGKMYTTYDIVSKINAKRKR